jgi:hypothetical protein
MVEESSLPWPPAEESTEAETDTTLEQEPESGEPAAEPASEPGFVCDCEEWMRSACERLPFYQENESRRYCVLHYSGKEKTAHFQAALKRKLNDKERKRSCCSKLFSDPCKLRCSRSQFGGSLCAEPNRLYSPLSIALQKR